MVVSGCKKSETPDSAFVTTLVSDTSMAAVSAFETADKGVIVIGRSFDNTSLGTMFKVNMEGDEVWRKKLSNDNLHFWKAIPIAGNQFITVGYPNVFNPAMFICKYNQDGELLNTFIDTLPESSSQFSYSDFKQLQNGNYVFCLTNIVLGYAFVIITDPNFNTISTHKYESNTTEYFGCFIRGIHEIDANKIAFTATTSKMNTNKLRSNLMVFTCDAKGKELSRNMLVDSNYTETPSYLGSNGNELFAVTSRMKGWNDGHGLFVDYLGNPNAQFVSGELQFVRFNTNGDYLGRKTFNGYPGNGFINSVHKTNDGGFLMCGTVNQNNYQTLAANTQCYILKLNANYEAEWSKAFNTTYPSLGIECLELSTGGYCLIGHQQTFKNQFNIILIKTNL